MAKDWYLEFRPCDVCSVTIDLKIDNLDRVSIPTKILATFDFAHPILGTTYGV